MATARIILDKRSKKQDGTFPVKIRVAHVKAFQRLGTSLSLTEAEFIKLMAGKNLKDEQKEDKRKLDALLLKANGIIDSLEPFDFHTFNTRFSQKGDRSDLIFLLNDKASDFEKDEKYGSRNLYNQAAAMLTEYINRNRTEKSGKITSLIISTVTPKWLTDFEKWALKVTYQKKSKGSKETTTELKYSRTTLGMYLIRVRAIFNEVISRKELSAAAYPFHKADNKAGYKIPQGVNNKRALSMPEIMSIYNYEPQNQTEFFAKDMFIFSYLASGINCIDMFRLRWLDLKKDHFTFIRKKTENKTGGTNKITISLTEDLLSIIERHGTRKLNNGYIFNVIPLNATEKEIKSKTAAAISAINQGLKKIAVKIGITEEISTYYARHSYSTNLMNNEAPLAFISKQLGHKDLKTTQNYLDSFTTDKAAEYQSNLLVKDQTG
ncbi:tyrosine-type recombinase/integrase [Pedobacter lithocola]|uniref:Tyrosine-type recombinase/integrase n=1 Tax=Pedobacter lithocola TaxID=1908239 RepID=A0ABV8PIE4_9SPHI